jgi:hypothetical protein
MLAIQMTSFVTSPPKQPAQFALMALSSYLLLAAASWLVEKKWGPSA